MMPAEMPPRPQAPSPVSPRWSRCLNVATKHHSLRPREECKSKRPHPPASQLPVVARRGRSTKLPEDMLKQPPSPTTPGIVVTPNKFPVLKPAPGRNTWRFSGEGGGLDQLQVLPTLPGGSLPIVRLCVVPNDWKLPDGRTCKCTGRNTWDWDVGKRKPVSEGGRGDRGEQVNE